MKNILIFTLSLAAFSFATVAKHNKESNATKIKVDETTKTSEFNKKESNTEYFDTLRKSNLSTKNTLGIGENKKGFNPTKTEICSISTNSKDNKNGTSLCGVPSVKSSDKSKNTTNKDSK